MLALLHIENVAVVEKIDIVFEQGFNVLSGETGAGKSIIIDALGAALGGRTSRELVRSGAESAAVSALFTGLSPSVRAWLEGNGYAVSDEDGELMIGREVAADGRSACRINGKPVTATLLRELGVLLLNLHGQHDSQQLLDEGSHIGYLDRLAGQCAQFEAYREVFGRLCAVKTKIEGLTVDEGVRERLADSLNYQISEIDAARLVPGEEEDLDARREVLRNAGRIAEALEEAHTMLYGGEEEDGVDVWLTTAERALSSIARVYDAAAPLSARLEELRYAAQDVAGEVRALMDSVNTEPGEQEAIEERLDLIHRLKRKYGGSVAEIIEFMDACVRQLEGIEGAGERLEVLEKEYASLLGQALKQAETLTALRREGAVRLEEDVTRELRDLDMPRAMFSVEITPRELCAEGADAVRFLISTNIGEELKPLARVASGGELARVMLAMKNILAASDDVATLVFDEVDAGVSGRASQKVARKLCSVAEYKQVLCVTHLPQIAAAASTHFLISKDEEGGRTYTSVTKLAGEDRLREVARLTSGELITETALRGAGELVDSYNTEGQV